MIEFDPIARITVFDYAEVHVDVVNRDGLKASVKPAATAGAVYAF